MPEVPKIVCSVQKTAHSSIFTLVFVYPAVSLLWDALWFNCRMVKGRTVCLVLTLAVMDKKKFCQFCWKINEQVFYIYYIALWYSVLLDGSVNYIII